MGGREDGRKNRGGQDTRGSRTLTQCVLLTDGHPHAMRGECVHAGRPPAGIWLTSPVLSRAHCCQRPGASLPLVR